MFIDFNLQWNDSTSEVLFSEASRLGYDGVAFVTIIDKVHPGILKAHKCQQKRLPAAIYKSRQGIAPDFDPYILSFIPHNSGQMVQLKRLHFIINSTADASNFANYAKAVKHNTHEVGDNSFYDILSVAVSDEKTWQQVINQGYVDMIAIDLYNERLPFPVKRNQLLLARSNNIYFEFCLDKALTELGRAKNFFRNVQYLTRYLKADRWIITSGATNPLQLRSPMDIAAIAQIFGCKSPIEAINVVKENCKSLLAVAAARRTNGSGFPTKNKVEEILN